MSNISQLANDLLPNGWKVPAALKNRFGEGAGKQRAMYADGHLLLVLHAPPGPHDADRVARFFYRDPQGVWNSTMAGQPVEPLRLHVEEFADRLERHETDFQQSRSAREYFVLLQALAPLHRTTRNMHAALQQAREVVIEDRGLITLRDRAAELEREAELLLTDSRNGMEYTTAKRSEELAERSYEMSVSAHRLNLLAALFFPIATVAAVFGMNLRHGLEQLDDRIPDRGLLLWGITAVSFLIGLMIMFSIAARRRRLLETTEKSRQPRS